MACLADEAGTPVHPAGTSHVHPWTTTSPCTLPYTVTMKRQLVMAATPRFSMVTWGLGIVLLALVATVALAVPPVERRAVELTFLKSKPGQREQLKTFIIRNWFAMDRIAKEQGLLSAFTVMDTGTDEGAWNVLVSVTYMNDKGYDGIVDAFERIRRAHAPVRIDGKELRDLGAIVDSKRLFEYPASTTP